MPWFERVFTLPNALTLSRVPLAGLVWVAPGRRSWLVAILALAAVTDIFDGRMARALRARRVARGEDPQHIGDARAVGAWLDPACDKLFVLSVLAAVGVAYRPGAGEMALIAAREIILAPPILVYLLVPAVRRAVQVDFRAGPAGKASTVTQFAALAAVVFYPPVLWILATAAGVVGSVAAFAYLVRTLRLSRYAATQPFGGDRWPRPTGHRRP